MALDPPRRAFKEERSRKGLKDFDAAARAQRMHVWGWSLYAGVPFGVGVGLLTGHFVPGVLLGPVIIFGVVTGIAKASGRGASILYMPTGATTPRRREYSRAKALEVRGEYEAAIRAYEVEVLDAPGVAEPYLRIARLCRDELGEMDSAINWFRRAQREAVLSPGEAIRTHRELAEIFLHILREPTRAAPELARLAEEYPHTPDGKWAARELSEIKESMARELRRPPPDG
jgi:tetratricopeptide (TPR) repeat protein